MATSTNFIGINTDELNELLEEHNNNIIYMGRPTCPGCIEMEPILDEVLNRHNLKIYYYNTKKAREEEFKSFDKVKKELNAEYIPLLLHYKGDKEMDRLDYYNFVESENNIDTFIRKAILG